MGASVKFVAAEAKNLVAYYCPAIAITAASDIGIIIVD